MIIRKVLTGKLENEECQNINRFDDVPYDPNDEQAVEIFGQKLMLDRLDDQGVNHKKYPQKRK